MLITTVKDAKRLIKKALKPMEVRPFQSFRGLRYQIIDRHGKTIGIIKKPVFESLLRQRIIQELPAPVVPVQKKFFYAE